MAKTVSFEDQLQRHLMKAELDFRARHQDGPSCLDWLAPHCGNLEDIYSFLRSLGYKRLEKVSETDTQGDTMRWVQTGSFSVFENTAYSEGLFSPTRF